MFKVYTMVYRWRHGW